jgi:hypothetical protein
MILDLEKYLSGMRVALDSGDNEKWIKYSPDIANMIIVDFYHCHTDLREEFTTALHTKEKLRELEIYEEHLADLLE